MNSICFVTQKATDEILLGVTNVCAKCYDTIHLGDTIHYDLQDYRYLCDTCQEKICAMMNEQCEIIESDTGGLF